VALAEALRCREKYFLGEGKPLLGMICGFDLKGLLRNGWAARGKGKKAAIGSSGQSGITP